MGGAEAPMPAGAVRTSRAVLVWSVAMPGYVFAVLQRTSLGVAGLEAAERFSISPAALSASVFLQVAVHVAVRLPGGLLSDRWGARRVLVLAGGLLAAGQLLLAVAPALGIVVLPVLSSVPATASCSSPCWPSSHGGSCPPGCLWSRS